MLCSWEILNKRKEKVILSKLVQLIWQGCPLTLGRIPLKWLLTEIKDPFQQVGVFQLKGWIGINTGT